MAVLFGHMPGLCCAVAACVLGIAPRPGRPHACRGCEGSLHVRARDFKMDQSVILAAADIGRVTLRPGHHLHQDRPGRGGADRRGSTGRVDFRAPSRTGKATDICFNFRELEGTLDLPLTPLASAAN